MSTTDALAQHLASHDKRIAKTKANGNCLFNSFSIVKYGSQQQHGQIRRKAVRYIREHQQDFPQIVADWKNEDIRSVDEYCNWMQQNTSWGDVHVLMAICEAYQCTINVIIHTHADEVATIVYGNPTTARETFDITYCCRYEHYSAVVPVVPRAHTAHVRRKRPTQQIQPLRRSERLRHKRHIEYK
jgi:hypothetical protein